MHTSFRPQEGTRQNCYMRNVKKLFKGDIVWAKKLQKSGQIVKVGTKLLHTCQINGRKYRISTENLEKVF